MHLSNLLAGVMRKHALSMPILLIQPNEAIFGIDVFLKILNRRLKLQNQV